MLHTKTSLLHELRHLVPATGAAEFICDASTIEEEAKVLLELKFLRLCEAHFATQEFSTNLEELCLLEGELRVIELLINALGNIAGHKSLRGRIVEAKELAECFDPAIAGVNSPFCSVHPGIVRELLLFFTRIIPSLGCGHGTSRAWMGLLSNPAFSEYLTQVLFNSTDTEVLTAAVKLAATFLYYAPRLSSTSRQTYLQHSGILALFTALRRLCESQQFPPTTAVDMAVLPLALRPAVLDFANALLSCQQGAEQVRECARQLLLADLESDEGKTAEGTSNRACGFDFLFEVAATSPELEETQGLWEALLPILQTLSRETLYKLLVAHPDAVPSIATFLGVKAISAKAVEKPEVEKELHKLIDIVAVEDNQNRKRQRTGDAQSAVETKAAEQE